MPTATGIVHVKTKKSASKSAAENRQKKVLRAAILLKQISDPTRLQVIQALADGDRFVGAICQELGLGQPAVSHHLALLRHGGIVAPERRGKNNFYALTESGELLAKIIKGLKV
jgi:DNA-binding transcriptional ArsR family regulator